MVSPNPVVDLMRLSDLDKYSRADRVVIYNASGKGIGTYRIDNNSMEIDVSNLIPGLYMYSLEGNTGVLASGKFIRQ